MSMTSIRPETRGLDPVTETLHYYQINVGRGATGDLYDELSSDNWEQLKLDIVSGIRIYVNPRGSIELHTGTGYWGDKCEESVHISFLALPSDVDLAHLRARLAVLADHYGQEAIALIDTESELITPPKN